jgi:nickel/cobalt transporter (NicO) family protein
MINLLTSIIGAAVVGILHMSAPDHWLTLCVLARNKQWTAKKIFRTSLITATGHVALSVVMGLSVVAVGLIFSHLISSYLDIGIGLVMVVAGLIVGIIPLVGKSTHCHDDHEHESYDNHEHVHGHEHHEHEHDSKNKNKNTKKLTQGIGYFAVLGAALSPDPSIIPIFLSAISAGFYFALELSVIFAISSIVTLLLLVQLGVAGLAKTLAKIPEKYNDSLVGFVIAAIGIYILVSG